jgi:hypothetical protein
MKKEWQKVIDGAMGVEPIKINSSLVSAQSRNRLYWTNIPGVVEPTDKGIILRDILETNTDPVFDLSEATGNQHYKDNVFSCYNQVNERILWNN